MNGLSVDKVIEENVTGFLGIFLPDVIWVIDVIF